MAKKLADIKEVVDKSTLPFLRYIETAVDSEVIKCLQAISTQTSVYIFSGVIRNFFLKRSEIRDVDVVLADRVKLEDFFPNSQLKRNSFGGYKLTLNNTDIDLWYIEDSWAFKHQKVIELELEKYLPATAYFNFSSIMFSLNESKFYYTTHFLRFLRDKQIDIVFKPNANYALCIINAFYYADKYNLRIAGNLKKHLMYLDRVCKPSYELAQLKHFGRLVYTQDQLNAKILSLACSETAISNLVAK